MLNSRIKKQLEDVIDVAFAEQEKSERERYKWFQLDISSKECQHTSGMYHEKTHIIEIYNPSLGAKHLAKCCLHELSHHIDWCQNGRSGHQKPFYDIYTKLIYASLDMGILELKDFDDNWSSDQNKVRDIVSRYVPHPVNYHATESVFLRVYNGFPVKDVLKQCGYKWNGVEQVWEKEVDGDIEPEEEILYQLGIVYSEVVINTKQPYYVISDSNMYIDAVVYIKAEGNTYEKREILKEYQFYFKKEKKLWVCKLNAAEYKHMMITLQADERLKDVRFSVLSQKKKNHK